MVYDCNSAVVKRAVSWLSMDSKKLHSQLLKMSSDMTSKLRQLIPDRDDDEGTSCTEY